MSANRLMLVVDDEPSMLRYARTLLELDRIQVETAQSGPEALHRIDGGLLPDFILLDVSMPAMSGLQVLQNVRQKNPNQRVIMMSCKAETPTVVEAIRLGAVDFLQKPFYKPQLDAVFARYAGAVAKSPAAAAAVPAREVTSGETIDELSEGFFLSASEQMQKVRKQALLIAKVDVPVLILGESGVGKEVMARFIYENSLRRDRPWMKVNCAAVPNELLESELFGYEAGAFTGAIKAKPGKFEICHRGTMMLDEIGEMSTALQSKLLHVLQDGEFCRLGGRGNLRADVRVIAATNLDIESAIATRRFREDLYYRLNAFTIKIPPLRERKTEIPLLLKHYMLKHAARLAVDPYVYSDQFVDECTRYAWPGNIRELSNVIKKLIILRDERAVVGEFRGGNDASVHHNDLKAMVRSLKDQAELQTLDAVLREHNWNRRRVAAQLNISYKALLYKIKQYGLEPPQPESDPTLRKTA